MIISAVVLAQLEKAIFFGLLSCFVAFLWAPLLTKLLYKYKIVRDPQYDATLAMGARKNKAGVPIMGGLLVVVTVAVITILFNWERKFTWVPIGVMLVSALLGAIDDILNNVYGKERRIRKLGHVLKLIRVHHDWKQRVWLIITFPWAVFQRLTLWLGSHPGKGLHVHERMIFQLSAGAITAWWILFKLGSQWQDVHVPFDGFVNLGWWMFPLITILFFLTSNAVNITDGMDGLAGGSLILTFAALTILSWLEGYQTLAILNGTVVGALITYTYFNIKPARFQMGDVGSLSLGALLAINTIAIKELFLLPLLGFIFYVELATVIIQILGRHLLGKRIFKMAPLHHHFELRGWSEEKTVMRFWIIHAGAVLLALWVVLY